MAWSTQRLSPSFQTIWSIMIIFLMNSELVFSNYFCLYYFIPVLMIITFFANQIFMSFFNCCCFPSFILRDLKAEATCHIFWCSLQYWFLSNGSFSSECIKFIGIKMKLCLLTLQCKSGVPLLRLEYYCGLAFHMYHALY